MKLRMEVYGLESKFIQVRIPVSYCGSVSVWIGLYPTKSSNSSITVNWLKLRTIWRRVRLNQATVKNHSQLIKIGMNLPVKLILKWLFNSVRFLFGNDQKKIFDLKPFWRIDGIFDDVTFNVWWLNPSIKFKITFETTDRYLIQQLLEQSRFKSLINSDRWNHSLWNFNRPPFWSNELDFSMDLLLMCSILERGEGTVLKAVDSSSKSRSTCTWNFDCYLVHGLVPGNNSLKRPRHWFGVKCQHVERFLLFFMKVISGVTNESTGCSGRHSPTKNHKIPSHSYVIWCSISAVGLFSFWLPPYSDAWRFFFWGGEILWASFNYLKCFPLSQSMILTIFSHCLGF